MKTLSPSAPSFKHPALWLALVMGVFQIVNFGRTLIDPASFSDYMGLPIGAGGPEGFVYVYGLRSLFIGLVVLVFVMRRSISALLVMALAALILPLGDAWLVYDVGGPTATVVRHLVIAVYIFITLLALLHLRSRSTGS
ncbi:MAG: DUF4267 domain-containing protein [Pseudomonadota bacterium]